MRVVKLQLPRALKLLYPIVVHRDDAHIPDHAHIDVKYFRVDMVLEELPDFTNLTEYKLGSIFTINFPTSGQHDYGGAVFEGLR
jgi:hypothetical protein